MIPLFAEHRGFTAEFLDDDDDIIPTLGAIMMGAGGRIENALLDDDKQENVTSSDITVRRSIHKVDMLN